MIVDRPNPSQVVLQTAVHNLDGTPKIALASAHVRVYHMSGAAEVEDLASTVLPHVGSSNVWRYVWTPGALVVGQYFAEYALVDLDGASFADVENLTIQDFALQVDVELIKQLKIGTWEIDNNQMIYKNTSGDEIARLDLYDINGMPTNGINMYKREPA